MAGNNRIMIFGPQGGNATAAGKPKGIGRKSRQFLPAQASCRDPGTGPELRFPHAAAQKSYMPSQPVWSPPANM